MPAGAAPRSRGLHCGFALACLFAMLLNFSPSGEHVENMWLDREFRLLREHAPVPAGADIVIVGIDENSLREFGVPMATLHAQLGELFSALARARPRAVGVDVALPEVSYDRLKPGLDAALARGMVSLRAVAPLVLGIAVDPGRGPRPLHKPFLTLAGGDGVGYVALPLDSDGVVRRFDERLGEHGEAVPTLAGQLSRRLGIAVSSGIIQFAAGPDYAYIPIERVLAWHAAGDEERLAAAFRNRIVLLGGVLPFQDRHRLPARLAQWDADDGTDYGVLIHAQALRSLAGAGLVQPVAPWVAALLALLGACAWWLTFRPLHLFWTVGAICALAAGSLFMLRAAVMLPVAVPALVALCALAARASFDAWGNNREKRRLRAAFAGLVSPAVLHEILDGRLRPELNGERRDIALLFSDVRGFTSLSEKMPPEAVTRLLNRYFERMARAIHARGGTLDKFMGDGIMAFFGAPAARDNPCADAFAAAKDMLTEVSALNRELRAEGQPELHIGIGLHYGPAVVGYLGAVERHEYTAIGDAVNTASRIEGLTKEAGCALLVSRDIRLRLEHDESFRPLGSMAIKGRAPVEVYGWDAELPINRKQEQR